MIRAPGADRPATMPPAIARIGRYEVIDELGRGAMGVVYRARDSQIGRLVALKVILTANAAGEDIAHFKQRFQREAQAAGRLSHPGIVTIHDMEADESGQPYLVMELVEGRPLDAYLEAAASAGAPLPFDRMLDLGIQLARALDYAHQRGVVHRDIKPANILVTADGAAKIADFGIAKLAGTEMTQEGTSLGTPSYMSPEQFRGAAVDARSDQFSLGAMLYWMCTGRKPFEGDSVTAVSFQVVFNAPARATVVRPGLPNALDAVLLRCLAKNPEQRYATCGELAADLEAVRAGRAIVRNPDGSDDETQQAAASSPAARTQSIESTRIGATRALAVPASDAPPRIGKRVWVAVGAAALLAAMVAGNHWLTQWGLGQHGATVAPVATPAVSAPPAGTSLENSAAKLGAALSPGSSTGRPAAPNAAAGGSVSGGTPANTPTNPAAATATLGVSCKHNFQSATLEIFADNELLLKTVLRGREHNYGLMKVYEGRVDIQHSIPAGTHVIRAWVTSEREGYDQQAAVGGTFAQGRSRTLEIEFGKGSALGVVDRKMEISLR